MSGNSITAKNLDSWLALAANIAMEAGDFLLRANTSAVEVTGEKGRDVKLAVDRTSEELIIAMLREQSSFAILSEERGAIKGKDSTSELVWIVDPLDGSMNYLKGIPGCCVSLGLWRADEPMLGVIYDFTRKELFAGIPGKGAWMDGFPIYTSLISEPDRAVLCTGFPVGMDFSGEALSQFIQQVHSYKKIRMFGSAALSLAYVAAGRVDAYYERDIRLWDVAAGLAIVQAAGGQVVRTESDQPFTLTVFAGNSVLKTTCP